jgi:hypothetical protein
VAIVVPQNRTLCKYLPNHIWTCHSRMVQVYMYTGFTGRSATIGGVKPYILLIMASELVHRIKKNHHTNIVCNFISYAHGRLPPSFTALYVVAVTAHGIDSVVRKPLSVAI